MTAGTPGTGDGGIYLPAGAPDLNLVATQTSVALIAKVETVTEPCLLRAVQSLGFRNSRLEAFPVGNEHDTLESIATLSDNHTVRQPAAAV